MTEERTAELEEEARRQYRVGSFNRRVAVVTENLARLGMAPDDDVAGFLCTCGRPDCDQVLSLTLSEYERVSEKPYRFLVAREHATDADDVLERHESYWIVEGKPQYRI
jgi:hypothetical protein